MLFLLPGGQINGPLVNQGTAQLYTTSFKNYNIHLPTAAKKTKFKLFDETPCSSEDSSLSVLYYMGYIYLLLRRLHLKSYMAARSYPSWQNSS